MKAMPVQIKNAVRKVLIANTGYYITATQIYNGLSAPTRRGLKSYAERCKMPEKSNGTLHAVAEAAKLVAEDTDGTHTKSGWKNCRLYCIKKVKAER
ncbi:MAG: hypothetical protein A2452_10240 [Candidatus Firestonebacteria bacterium RIFOXYC2_FULL_39_67]|nr:MAG: hypothetical protein A2536_06610 [Candidatus Firestonebacteria bacterium RIFOXYD2_FULL_39_29]OGF54283.1 MAG: hypothetical protein A2452_10240 [Candidatus Firestonebacteria bacterium RIFOXYC2_FULL_39_67]